MSLEEPESGLPARRLGAEERVEGVSQRVRRQPGSVVRHLDHQSVIVRVDLNAEVRHTHIRSMGTAW